MSRMFRTVSKVWNIISGCTNGCLYCIARRQAKRFGHICQFCPAFEPHIHRDRKVPVVPPGGVIFVTWMGDLFCDGVKDEWIEFAVQMGPKMHPKNTFLFCTKNPERYLEFYFPDNCLLGATIETDLGQYTAHYSKAPDPMWRASAMKKLDYPHKFISIEPIMRFTPWFHKEIIEIQPEIVEVGYENYHMFEKWGDEVEPYLEDTKVLIKNLRDAGITVKEKSIREAWHVAVPA